MGLINVVFAIAALYVGFLFHLAFPTSYDWIIVGTIIVIAAFFFPDDTIKELIGMIRSYYKSKVNYRSWWFDRF